MWIFCQKTCICVKASVKNVLWERKMKVSKLFKSANMLFSICFQHKQFNIFSLELFGFWNHHLCQEKNPKFLEEETLLLSRYKSISILFYIFLSPWMYQDGALYSWICSKHIRADMITSKREKFHFFQTYMISQIQKFFSQLILNWIWYLDRSQISRTPSWTSDHIIWASETKSWAALQRLWVASGGTLQQ